MKQILSSSLVRYVLVGGLSYIIEISLLYLLGRSDMAVTLAVTIAFWCGFVISFILQKLIAFKNNVKHTPTVIRQTILYAVLVLFNYVFTLLLVSYIEQHIGVIQARTLAIVITTAWNYFAYKKIIFANSDKLSD